MHKRIGLIIGLFLLTLALLTGCGGTASQGSSSSSSSSGQAASSSAKAGMDVTIQMLNVGQGDSILIQTGEQTVLIDTSDLDERDKFRAELKRVGVTKIDKVILTHPHADHIGGMDVLLKEFQVGEVYDNGMPSTSKLYIGYMKTLKSKGIKHGKLAEGDTLDFGNGVKFTVLSPTKATVKEGQQQGYKHDPNNESVVGRLTYGDFSMLFTGDAEKDTEAAILKKHANDIKSTILKSPHHGSHTSSSVNYLKAVAPEAALISCGINNDYGHPHKETMQAYKKMNIKIYETDKNGTITVTTNGKTYEIKTEKGGAQK